MDGAEMAREYQHISPVSTQYQARINPLECLQRGGHAGTSMHGDAANGSRALRHARKAGAGDLPLHAFASHILHALLALLHDAADGAHGSRPNPTKLLMQAGVGSSPVAVQRGSAVPAESADGGRTAKCAFCGRAEVGTRAVV